jgi:hypothetical protein
MTYNTRTLRVEADIKETTKALREQEMYILNLMAESGKCLTP